MRNDKKRWKTLMNKEMVTISGRADWIGKCIKENWIFIIEVLFCILVIFFHAMKAGHYVDFHPINGTFQNYNPIRRFLSGQIPYKDFQDYLGLGHLYTGTIFTFLFGGTYRSSLIAFSFLTLAGFSAISYAIAKLIFEKKECAIALTNIVVVILVVQPLFFNGLAITEEIKSALECALDVGNSARFVRGLIFPISCGLLSIGRIIIKKNFANKGNVKCAIMVGIVAGFSFIWSNDFGISCWLCILLISFWYNFTTDRKLREALKVTAVELVASVGAIFIFVEIFTLGNLGAWLQYTFGTGGYQRWYYNSEKTYWVWEADTSFIVIVQAGVCLYFLIRMMISRNLGDSFKFKYAGLAYANMVGVCVIQEYRILSGGNSREVALTILFVTILYGALSLMLRNIDKQNNNHVVSVISMVISAALIISSAKDELILGFMTEKSGVYVEKMDGNLISLGEDLLRTNQFLSGDRVFATYASAQEVVSSDFQPSGTDYIIHVLGDAQREQYLEAFNNQEFRYVATIKESYTDYEYWVERANWFFYREIYEKWHPVFANTYEVYWEKNADEEQYIQKDGFELNVSRIDDSMTKIIVQCDSEVDGVADIFIDYEVKNRSKILSVVNMQRLLNIANTGTVYASGGAYYESNYLKDKSAEYIPVPIIDGYGEVTLTAQPRRNASLEIKDCRCEKIFTVTSDFLEVTEVIDGSILCVPVSEESKNLISDILGVVYNGIYFQIEKINQDDTGIYIYIAGNTDTSINNMVELVR